MTPGIHPKQVKINTITNEPQPLSITASGGNIIHRSTLKQPIFNSFLLSYKQRKVTEITKNYALVSNN